jgi:WD repeat-containing protein 68
MSFACGKDVFGTVGADASVRMFDLRSLEHSIILYESSDSSALLRIAWNKQDPNYLAVVPTNSSKAIILDIRMPSIAVAELVGHQAALNGIAWAPHSSCHICTVSDDKQALIWDVTTKAKPIEDPILAYTAGGDVNQIQWCSSHEDWVGVCFDNHVQILRV